MPAALVAQYPWWSLSDPVITFAMRLTRLGLSPRLVGPRQLDFLARRFPSEAVFRELPVHWSASAQEAPQRLVEALSGPGPRLAVFFDEPSFLACAQTVADLGARAFLYSTEIPDPGQFDAGLLARAFAASRARLLIQDQDRLRGYAQATGYVPADPVLLPNASLPDEDYGEEDVEIPGVEDWSRTLVLSGSIQTEHATLETMASFLRCAAASRPGWKLLVSGWGGAGLEELRAVAQRWPEIVLNTDFLSGPQIRRVYALCRAGVVSYYNGGYNHRHCGRASGKLYWICRAGKPVLSNDNLSISGLVREHGLGFDLTRAASLDALDDAGPAGGAAMGARARAFYATEAQAMSATLDALLADNGTDPAQGGSR
ncbi:hypothetical protein SAMN04488503_2821 [Humidesulfovibrio mexicanus]|uniref:Glycosyl transferases group 1 n=1 Tax=Humidesulfovibrio mexicanus TaxID=147047 RepID=A0A239BV84_9BACT|nr:glycosyltransferase [Humidesulfovibrio mexicanus]SNS11836.1 hypothetical protein SAMN04488503_2821 [Humidesulfovibrio mexicanus]